MYLFNLQWLPFPPTYNACHINKYFKLINQNSDQFLGAFENPTHTYTYTYDVRWIFVDEGVNKGKGWDTDVVI